MFHKVYSEAIITGVGVNNSASAAHDGTVIGGNSTDRALMTYLVEEKVAQNINKDSVCKI